MDIREKGKRRPGEIRISGKCEKCGGGMRQLFEDNKIIEICQNCGNFNKFYFGMPKMIFPNYGDVNPYRKPSV